MDTKDIVALPLAKRLEVMEALWNSFCQDDSSVSASPDWHEAILKVRARKLKDGSESASPWSKAKARIRVTAGKG